MEELSILQLQSKILIILQKRGLSISTLANKIGKSKSAVWESLKSDKCKTKTPLYGILYFLEEEYDYIEIIRHQNEIIKDLKSKLKALKECEE